MTAAAESTPESPVDVDLAKEQPDESDAVVSVGESGAAEPEQAENAASEAEQTEPEQTENAASEPEQAEPEQTEPEQTEPEQTEPEQTEPEQTEPEQTEIIAPEVEIDSAEAGQAQPEAPQTAIPKPRAPLPGAPSPRAPQAPRPAAPRPGKHAEAGLPAEHTQPADAPAAGVEPVAPTGSGEPWGRVDDDGTVSVREGAEWRVVGQFPDGSREEALAYFERKYADLASEVTLLEVRHRRGGASPSDLRTTAEHVRSKLQGAAAVGDLASLDARVAALTDQLAAATESEAAAAREAVEEAVRARTEIVEKAEALAARDPKSVQWKQASVEITALFDEWQTQQRTGPRLPKSTGQQLWKRFRDARATLDKHRREFYAELDEAHKIVRDRKVRLVERAEALAPKGEDGIGAYRELLDQWKTAGRAGKKADDALWSRFKAAGDALYGARGEREAAEAEASREKIAQKRALLEEAKAVADEAEISKARQLLTSIQRRWDDIGQVFPRDAERGLDDDLRKIEQGVRAREDADWRRNNPETKARANDMTRQLMDAIEKLEQELAAAKKSGDKAAIAKASDALEARKGWLKALGG